MHKIVVTTEKFIAFDGMEFDSAAKCEAHEYMVRQSQKTVRFIVNEDGELGVRVGDRNYWYYKDDAPMATNPMYRWRFVEKYEFDSVVLARKLKGVKRHDNQGNATADVLDWRNQYAWNDPDPNPEPEATEVAA